MKVFFPPFDRAELIKRLRAGAARLARELPIREAFLIGSWAQGRATALSDVDVLIVYQGPVRDDVIRLARQCFGLRGLEVHAFAEDQWETLGPVIERMKRPAVALWPLAPDTPTAVSGSA